MRYRITNPYIQKPSDCKSAESGGRLDVKKRQKHYRMKNNSYICNVNPQTPPLTSHNSGSNFGTHYRMNQTILFTMSQAILITAYKDLCQLKRLINKMQDLFIYVHIDKNAKELYSELQKEYKEENRVKIVSKYSILWGSYNHLRAVVYLMKLVEHNPEVKYIHMVSGQDYPVVDSDIFAKFEFCNNVYMTCKIVTETNDCVLGRYNKKHLLNCFLDIRSGLYKRLDKRFAKHRERIGCFDVRELYKGMIWASMPVEVCQYVLSFIRSNEGRCFFNGLKFSEIPEEVFFQTIIMHSKYKDFVVSDNLRYTLWQEKNGSYPGILDESDYESICNSNAVFARKIDSNYSIKLISLIDKKIDD